LRVLRELGSRAELAITPHEPVEPLAGPVGEIDMLLPMAGEPGFGGHKFPARVLPKIRRAREILDSRESSVWLQVDGGVTEGTIERAAEAGADVFVAGSAVYGAQDPAKAVDSLRALAVGASDRG